MDSWNLLEVEILLWIQEHIRTDVLDKIMPLISGINNSGIMAIVTVVVLLLWKRYRKVGWAALGSLGVEFIFVNLLIKPSVQRIRPFVLKQELILLGERPADFSFPSGHTGTAFAVSTVMLLCMPARYGVTATVIAFLIAFSRLYNGAHYPTDVLAGMIIGIITGVIASVIYRKSNKNNH